MSAEPLQTWAGRALDALRDECAWHTAALGDALGEARIRVESGPEGFDLFAAGGVPRVGPPAGPAAVRLHAHPDVLRAVLRGDLPVLTALRSQQLDLRGALPALTHAARAWRIAVAGAARSPRCVRLWDDFTHPSPGALP